MFALHRHRLHRLHVHPFLIPFDATASVVFPLSSSKHRVDVHCMCLAGRFFRQWRLLQQISATFLQFFFCLLQSIDTIPCILIVD